MYPIVCRLGPFTLYSYGIALAIALGVSVFIARRAVSRLPESCVALGPDAITDLLCLSVFGGILGGRLLYVVLNWEMFARAIHEIPAIWHGGLIWYGGFLGGLFSSWLYARAHGRVWLSVLDQLIPVVSLGHAIGRVGCFFNGCCSGRPTDQWYGVVFPDQHGPVIPTQLIEATLLVGLYVVLRGLQHRQPPFLRQPGRLFAVYLIGYGSLRFAVEFLRVGQPMFWMNLTLPQLFSIVMILWAATLLARQSVIRNPQSTIHNLLL